MIKCSPLISIKSSYNEFECFCKIEINKNQNKEFGSGFFIKLEKNKKPLYFLMTNEHIISKEIINKKGEITIFYNNEEEKRLIQLNKERFIKDYSDINIDATIVEILDKDNINKNYFISPKYYDNNFD